MLSFSAGSGTNASLIPGDAIEISVIAQTSTTMTLNENLTFNTNLPFPSGNFTVPISGRSVIVGLDASTLNEQINVYPNPVADVLTIEVPTALQNLQLFDIAGKELSIKAILNKGSYTISTETLSRGVYFLKINHGTQQVVKKVIKQ